MTEQQAILKLLHENIENYCQKNSAAIAFDPDHPVVRLHEPTTGGEEIFAALETMLSTFTTMGKKVRVFEQQYAAFNQTRYGVMSNSGSSANLLSIAALANPVTPNGLKPGDEVIVPALSWSTTIWPLIQHQLVPVFVDCCPRTLNLDIHKLEQAIGPKTRAIKLVHVYGNPCNMDAILPLVNKNNLWLIEDCCEAMGARYRDKPVGSFGDISNFSFFFSHHISTLEGGMSVTQNFALAEMLRILRAHGWSREADEHRKYVDMYPEIDPRFIFINQGYNLRPTEVNAAMGQIQLPRLEGFTDARRKTAVRLKQSLGAYAELFDFQAEEKHGKHVWFGFPVFIKKTAPFSVKDITAFLNQKGIETRPVIAGNMARHPAFKLYHHKIAGTLEGADHVMQQGFALPCHQAVTAAAADYMTDMLIAFVRQVSHTARSFVPESTVA